MTTSRQKAKQRTPDDPSERSDHAALAARVDQQDRQIAGLKAELEVVYRILREAGLDVPFSANATDAEVGPAVEGNTLAWRNTWTVLTPGSARLLKRLIRSVNLFALDTNVANRTAVRRLRAELHEAEMHRLADAIITKNGLYGMTRI